MVEGQDLRVEIQGQGSVFMIWVVKFRAKVQFRIRGEGLLRFRIQHPWLAEA